VVFFRLLPVTDRTLPSQKLKSKFNFGAIIHTSFHVSSHSRTPPRPPPHSPCKRLPAYKSFLLNAATIRDSAGIPQAQLKERCGGCSIA